MEYDKSKALYEAYLCIKDNLFFKHLTDVLDAKEAYQMTTLCNAIDWEDCCRSQGQLRAVRSIKETIEKAKSCKTESSDSDIL